MEQEEVKVPLLDESAGSTVYLEHNKKYKDIGFLVLFGVNLVVILAIALLYGLVALTSNGQEVVKVADNGNEYDITAEHTPSVQILLGMVSSLAVGVIMTVLWIFTLSRIASFVLNAILISIILVPITFGIVLFGMGFYSFGAALLAFSIVLLVGALFIKPRMDFAAVNLKVACTAVLQMPSIFAYAMLAVCAQVVFSVVWGMAVVGYASSNNEVTIHAHGLLFNIDECTTYVYGSSLQLDGYDDALLCAGGTCRACVCDGYLVSNQSCVTPKLYGWAYFWLLLSLFWTSAVISNVVHCTASSAVSAWWVTPQPSAATVHEGFERATTTSLGSICFGSLLVALVRTLRSALHVATKQLARLNSSSSALRTLQSLLTGLLRRLLALLDRLMVYFNRYALCFVAMYQYDFLAGSKAACGLFQQRGFGTLLNDDIIDGVLNIGHVMIGVASMSTGYLYGSVAQLGRAYTVLLTVFGFAAGYLTSQVALATISSAVSTVYVSFVDRPLALEVLHACSCLFACLFACWCFCV
jgi:hypothetical protein